MNLSSLSSSLKSLQKRSDMHLLRKLWHVGTGLAGFVVYTSTNISLDSIGRGLVFFAVLVLIVESFRLKKSWSKSLDFIHHGTFYARK